MRECAYKLDEIKIPIKAPGRSLRKPSKACAVRKHNLPSDDPFDMYSKSRLKLFGIYRRHGISVISV
ncbi:hypothetical protein FRC03_010041 [Tulasnella sp. 419]|nr:hypothetical protein FRC03_010041 [Tulasnella sp. 419]